MGPTSSPAGEPKSHIPTDQRKLNPQPQHSSSPANPHRELFAGVIPTSPLAHVLREAAQQEGWVPPIEQVVLQSNRKKAGESSGRKRKGRGSLRRSLVKLARTRMSAAHRRTPYSNAAFAALRAQYDYLLTKSADDPNAILSAILSALSPADLNFLKRISDETLMADLKAIRRDNGVRR